MNTYVKHFKDFRLIVLLIFTIGLSSTIFGDNDLPANSTFLISAKQKKQDVYYEYSFKIINFESHPAKSTIHENIATYFESNSKIKQIDISNSDKKYLVYSPKNVNEHEMIKHFEELNIHLIDFKKGTLSKLSEN
ncbi:MAG: hypothetical protein ACO1O6_12335 [Bacteroidota bacterium]